MTTAVDLFAGAGGFSTGARAAGVEVLLAANHWPAAVRTHARNHPGVDHWTQDLHQADWSRVPAHDMLLASPACQGHTPARGKERPHHDAARSTAWAVVSCAEYHRPEVVLVENVEPFMRWALYPAWKMAMNALGYSVAEHIVDAADHGVPQNRVRVYLVCTRSLAPLRLALPKLPHVAASSIIDWSAGSWSTVHRAGRAASTLARFEGGRRDHGDRFLMAYYGSSRGGRSLERPLGTVTTRERYALVDGDRMRMLTVREYLRAMGFPEGYELPDHRKTAVHMLGNAVCPKVAEDVINLVRAAA